MRRALGRFVKGLGLGGRAVSVLLTSDAEMRELNREHRGQDRPTDVLSWSYINEGDAEDVDDDAPPPLGDLAVSLERAAAQARENGWDLHTELLRLLAHGCAHLAGYDHETAPQERAMRTVEDGLLAEVGLPNIYPPARRKR